MNKNREKGSSRGNEKTSNTDTTGKKKPLTLNEKMKSALIIKCKVSESAASDLLDSLN